MQKVLLALLGASLCALASAQYGKYGHSYDSYDNSGYKTEIKHDWEEKSYKGDDKYGGYGKSDGYGKKLEGKSSRYFVLESKKGKSHLSSLIDLFLTLFNFKGYEPRYESKKY